ncbi:MAG: putative ABC transporter permease [Clostridia bacterium]|nr:putative ABC transporter permease [Clostridia bacterium]
MNTKRLSLILIVVIVSFLGFCVENIFMAFDDGIINNRNMLLPFLLGYGLAILAFYTVIGTPDAPRFLKKELQLSSFGGFAFYFAMAFLGVCIAEIVIGYAVEWSCGIIWWDYTDIPLHITRYTSVPTSTIFALLITVFMKFFFNPLLNGFSKMNPRALAIISISLIVLLSIDFIHSGIYMLKNRDLLRLWRFELKKPIKQIFIDLL